MPIVRVVHTRRTRPETLAAQGYQAKAYHRERAIYVAQDISGRPRAHAALNAETAQYAVNSAHERNDPDARWFWAETVNGKPFAPPE